MSTAPPTPANAATPTPSWALLRTLGIVATVCGVTLVTVYQATLPSITRNKKIATERAVLAVVPGATRSQPFILSEGAVVPSVEDGPAMEGLRLHAAYDEGGTLKGVAAEASARGYADIVRLLYSIDLDRQRIVGFRVIQMRETPGIGDKIITDDDFQKNFAALDAQLDAEGDALAHPIVTVGHGTKSHPWEIDAISGATITSRAVGRALDASAQQLLPALVHQADRLRAGRP